MPPRSQGLTSHYPLKMKPEERAIVDRTQAIFTEAGLNPSLNEVLRHLIRRAEIPIPRTLGEGVKTLQEHTRDCEDCEPYTPPRCLDGLYLRELNRWVSNGDGGAPG